MNSRKFLSVYEVSVSLMLFGFCQSAIAVPLIDINVSPGHIAYTNLDETAGIYRTASGPASTYPTAAQLVGLDFQGTLANVADIPLGAAIFLTGIKTVGDLITTAELLTYHTEGGRLELWDNHDRVNLLLSGDLKGGVLTAVPGHQPTGTEASRFEAPEFVVTGGLLANRFPLAIADFYISIEQVQRVFSKRMFLGTTYKDAGFNEFSGIIVDGGVIGRNQPITPPIDPPPPQEVIPEPASMLLLLGGLAGGAVVKRRKS